jgi:hypothetical protein
MSGKRVCPCKLSCNKISRTSTFSQQPSSRSGKTGPPERVRDVYVVSVFEGIGVHCVGFCAGVRRLVYVVLFTWSCAGRPAGWLLVLFRSSGEIENRKRTESLKGGKFGTPRTGSAHEEVPEDSLLSTWLYFTPVSIVLEHLSI